MKSGPGQAVIQRALPGSPGRFAKLHERVYSLYIQYKCLHCSSLHASEKYLFTPNLNFYSWLGGLGGEVTQEVFENQR